jgi:hypothetical protein
MPIDDAERDRRRRLVQVHIDAENAHDLPAIMATFADDAENVFNSARFVGLAAIADIHVRGGFTSEPGAFEGLHSEVVREYFTDEEIILEGFFVGKFVRPLNSVPPTGKDVRAPFVCAYRFNAAGKLVHERVVMNFGELGDPMEAR